ncbi:MAG: cytochrome d ubiquinol oxidase subunit II [Burkholderiaceae bacterium]|nr:cytochrome d ubiquinol oxidase subunit II [Burkholderiaceae bacterium]
MLVAFPFAHGIVLTELYLPVAIMLAGLILRGVSFDFRAKVNLAQKPLWNFLFYFGSLVTAVSQGVMIGRHIIGYESGVLGWVFAALVGICLPAGYALLGATWLIMKTEGSLQLRAISWAKGKATSKIPTPSTSQVSFASQKGPIEEIITSLSASPARLSKIPTPRS